MQLDDAAKLVEAIAKLIGAVAWPTAVTFAVLLLRPAIERFLSTLSEVRLKGSGFEASAIRRLDVDATSQKLYDFWKPGGKVDRANAARIAACMNQLGIRGSVAQLINGGTTEDRARVISCLALDSEGNRNA
jgi:hypothetical protein